MTADVAIEFEDSYPRELAEAAAANPAEIRLVESHGFDGGVALITALVTLSPVTIKSIASVVIAHIEAKGRVKVKVGGIEIEGVSESNVVSVLERVEATRDRESQD